MFIDVEVKDCEKVLALNNEEWEGCELVVKVDETTNVRKKKTKGMLCIFSGITLLYNSLCRTIAGTLNI